MQKNSWLVILSLFFWGGALAQAPKYTVEGDTLINLPGYRITLTPQGFPQQITSFSMPVSRDTATAVNVLLAENIHFHIVRLSDGKDIRLKAGGVVFTKKEADSLQWEASGAAPEIRMDVSGSLGSKGIIEYKVRMVALEDLDLKDIVLHIPFEKSVARYVLGLGLKGQYNPDTIYHWNKNMRIPSPAGAWIGSTSLGLAYSLFWRSFFETGGKAGIDVGNKGKSMLVNNYSGQQHLKKGDTLDYDFILGPRALPKEALHAD